MSDRVLDRETLLDLVVNIIPMGIILFFIALFLLYNPFGHSPVALVLSQLLLVVPFLVLAVITYVSGRIISESGRTGGSPTADAITEATTGEVATSDSADEE